MVRAALPAAEPAQGGHRFLRVPASWWMIALSAPGYILISYLSDLINPAGIAVARTVIPALVLGLAVALRFKITGTRPLASLTRRDIPRIVILGCLGYPAYSLLLGTGQETVSAAVTSMLINVSSLVTVVVGAVVLGERRSRASVTWLIAGFLGTVLIIMGGSSSRGGGISLEALWVVGSAIALSAFVILQQPLLDRARGLDVTFAGTLGGLVLAVPLMPFARVDVPNFSGTHLTALLALGVICTAAAYVAWAYTLAQHGAGDGALLLFIIPVFTSGLDWLVFGKMLVPLAAAGGLLTLVSVYFATKTPHVAHQEGPLS